MKKKYIIYICVPVILILLSAVFFSVRSFRKRHVNENAVYTTLYYVNEDKTTIEQRGCTLYYKDKNDIVYKIADELKGQRSFKTISGSTEIRSIERLEGNTMRIDLNEKPDTVAAFAFIKSVCAAGSVVDVSGVQVTVDGEPMTAEDGEPIGCLNAGQINLSSDITDISTDAVALYHLTESGKLRREMYSIAASGKLNTERLILEKLASQPENGELRGTYKNDDTVISAETSGRICFVNLKSKFEKDNSGGGKENIAIYSIVNSLTELPDVDGVVFLIDGKRCDKFGSIDISNVMKPDYNIVENK